MSDPTTRLREALALMLYRRHWPAHRGTPPHGYYDLADAILAALPEHREDVLAHLGERDSGVAYCTAHNGVIDCDEAVCDFVDWSNPEHKCPACGGDGVAPSGEEECADCDGHGTTPCAPQSLTFAAPSSSTEEREHGR